MNDEKIGVLYIVTGDNQYYQEAVQSAQSVKKYHPDLNICLISDLNIDHNICFDRHIHLKNESNLVKLYKINGFSKSPYDVTLFLDSDTFICSPLDDLFELSKHYDIALAHAPIRKVSDVFPKFEEYGDKNIPDSYPEFNTGIILFQKNKKTRELFLRWRDIYIKYFKKFNMMLPDQSSLRDAIYGSDLLVCTLTPEYNCRYEFLSYVHGEIKILHGRYTNPGRLAKRYNKNYKSRVIIPGVGTISQENVFIRILKKIRTSVNF